MKEGTSGSNFLRKLVGFSIGSWGSFAISFFAMLITTRIFSPEEMGKISMFILVVGLLTTILLVGQDQAYVRYYHEPPNGCSVGELTFHSVTITMVSWLILDVILVFSAYELSYAFFGEVNIFAIVMASITCVASNILRFSSLTFRMRQDVLNYSLQSILLTTSTKALVLFSAFIQPTYNYYLLFYTLAYMLFMFIYVFIQRNELNIRDFRYVKGTFRILLKFGIPLVPVAVITWLNEFIPRFVLTKFEDYASIGIYSAAISLAAILNIIQAGFNTYWAAYVYENYKTSREKIEKVHHLITYGMVSLALVTIVFNDLIIMLLGKEYEQAKLLFPFLIWTNVAYTVSETTVVGINISKKTHYHLVTVICVVLVNLCLSFILIPVLGMVGAAISTGTAGLTLLITRSFIGLRLYPAVKNLYRTTVAFIFMIIGSFTNWILIDNLILRLSIMLLILVMLSLIYHKEVLILSRYLKYIVSNIINPSKKRSDG